VPPEHPKFGLFPTGATLVLDFDADHWAEVSPGRGEVVDFAIPRELPDPN
jgi:phosphohistidine phosphatase